MTEKKEFQVNKNTPFWDASLTDQERIDWLLKEMTVEEKLGYLASSSPDLPRLGIPGVSVGGEAAHGVEGRNDQNGLGKPDVTTSFPQPIGMSASWDPELIRQAGEITGTEARVVWHRHEGHGLSRWAPTVDLERDPRWGRNEEGYGEDPVLTGKMAGAYIRGMQGDDPKYLRCAATLKHFYGNNTEVGRGWKNSSIDPRNKYELYLEPFRRCIEDGGAEGIMTAYNKINGTIGILNPEVTDILKKQYGLRHVVSDGGAMGLVVNLHHYFGQHAETIATALKAGVDAMSDDPRMVEQAAREAYELGILKEEDMDRSIRCMMETKLRLGVYDRENLNPYDRVTEDDIDSPKAREICKELSRESIVLLKNENGALPLDKALKAEDIAIVGPLGGAWYQDWYGGTAPYRTTFLQGMEVLKQENITFADGLDRVVFRCDGKGLAVAEDGTLQMADEPDVFIKEYWGEGSYTFKSVRTGKYLGARLSESQGEKPKMGQIAADREEAFDWFVMEIFHVEPQEDGSVVLTNRFHYPVYRDVEGFFSFEQTEGIPITMEVVENGIEKAVAAVRGKKQVLLALGCNSVINAKEEIDRNTLELPEEQEMLLDRITEVNPNTVLVLFTNYPYTLQKAMEKLPAIIMSATGSQDMGSAMAEAVLGTYAPAGRLNMTWYESIDQLPDIDNYDIIKGKRTYRYFDGKVLYPFGYGLTYTTFAYENYKISLKDDRLLQISLDVRNTGATASDEVVQIYGSALESDVPIINAGDGGHNHPTQTLADLLTIKREKGRLNNMTIGFCGDLMFGRTVHSLIKAMSRYEGIKFILISPDELKLPDYIRTEVIEKNNIPYEEISSLEDAIGSLDVLYMTRVQKERFFNEADYIRLKDTYILDKSKLALARPDLSILHPLPRVNEISVEVDDDPRACYFRQALNGKYVRMALIMDLLGLDKDFKA